MAQEKIIPTMTIAEVFERFPQKAQRLAQTMTSAGLHCVGCSAATWETLEAGMLGHGMSRPAIEALIGKLNAILEEEIPLDAITVTARAVTKFHQIAAEEGKAGWSLRFGHQAGGCSGFEYLLDFSEKPEEDDEVLESNGLKIHIKGAIIDLLRGSVIDYVDGLHGAGFKISNPNVKSSCGCGKSQGY